MKVVYDVIEFPPKLFILRCANGSGWVAENPDALGSPCRSAPGLIIPIDSALRRDGVNALRKL
jgi:hypothetical protein